MVLHAQSLSWDDRRNLTELDQDDLLDLVCSECEHTWSGPVTIIRVDGEYVFVLEEEARGPDGVLHAVKTSEVFCPECGSDSIEREGTFQLEEYREKLRENWKLHQLTDLESSQSRESMYPEKPYHKGFLIDETRVTPLERIMRRRQGWKGAQPAKRGGYHHWFCLKGGIHLNMRPSEHPWAMFQRPQFALDTLVNALAEGNDWLEVKFISQDIMVPGPKGFELWATKERLEFLISADVLQDEELQDLSTYIRLSYGKARMMALHNPPFFLWRDFVEFLELRGKREPSPRQICDHVEKVEHQRANMPENMAFLFVLFPEGNQFVSRPDISDHPTCVDIVLDRIGELERERAFEFQLDDIARARDYRAWRAHAAIHKFETPFSFKGMEKTRVPRWVEQIRRPLRTNLRMAKKMAKLEQKDGKEVKA